jgi:zinc protease
MKRESNMSREKMSWRNLSWGKMTGRVLIVFALLISACAFGAEKEKLPKDLPAYGPLKAYAPPAVIQQKLPNGLTLWMVAQRGFPKVAFTMAVRGGLAADPADAPGLAEFMVKTVNQGTRTRSARQIAEQLQGAGGDWQGTARADALVLGTSVLSSKAEPALAVLADVAENATFPESEVELARRNLADDLRQREGRPGFLAQRALAEVMFGSHPYHVIAPTQAALAKITSAQLREQYAQRFRPDQAVLVAVGDFDANQMAALAGKYLGTWRAAAGNPVPPTPKPEERVEHAIYSVPRPGSVQTTLSVGQFGPTRSNPDFVPAQVTEAIYGGMFGSRLVKNIREDKGYTYSPGSVLQPRREAGLLRTQADVRNAVSGATLNEIIYELNRVATTTPTAEELSMAERYLVGTRAIALEAIEGLARELATLWVDGLTPQTLGEESQRVLKVTGADVEKMGKKYYPDSRAAFVAVGEPKIIDDQLNSFGLPIKPAPQVR